jgi:signal transduction histidine kinase/DNA-binding NarL/FixJ family response regulator
MSTFAAEAKRLLDHDRLSAYLLTNDGRAFERFAVATSPIAPGEGVIIPFEDVGLRHVVITNRALVSSDIASDPRIVGREDRVVARAGFHGLISVPLRLNGRPFGVLNFVSRAPGFYREEDIPIAEQIGDQVAGFVGNLRVQERMRTLIRHEAVETERTRLARELYHAVAQSSVGIDAVAEALEQRLTGSDEWACRQAARVRRLLREELGEVRRAVADLGPRGLDSHTLTKAMEAAVSSSGAQGVTPRLALEGDPAGLSSAVVKATYRIFQEALGNVRQHAEASKVEVELRIDERDLLLRVHDNGVGFDPDDLGESSGLGLPFMRERALALGGMLNVESAPLSGTTVTFELFGARGAAEARVHDEPVELATAVMLRVFVVERHALLRTGLVALIGRADDMRVVGEAATLEETRGQVRRLSPDAVLVDSSLGDAEVERTIADIRATVPSCRVLVLSEYGTHDVDFIAAGASGVVPKSLRPEELADAVRAVATGGRVASFPHSAGEAGSAGISERERAILALMTTGRTNAEIGSTLFLATKTVERQVATVVRKLNARNRAHAVAIAVARHIVEAPSDDA